MQNSACSPFSFFATYITLRNSWKNNVSMCQKSVVTYVTLLWCYIHNAKNNVFVNYVTNKMYCTHLCSHHTANSPPRYMWQKSAVTYVTLHESYISNATKWICHICNSNLCENTACSPFSLFCFIYNSVERVGNIMWVHHKTQLLHI